MIFYLVFYLELEGPLDNEAYPINNYYDSENALFRGHRDLNISESAAHEIISFKLYKKKRHLLTEDDADLY